MAHGKSLIGRTFSPDDDETFFAAHPDRNFRLRAPAEKEFEREFRSLGPHAVTRRRVIVARAHGYFAKLFGIALMPVPFLRFADETIEDDDATLRPIFDGIMRQKRAERGL